jgi:hypothetical protein
LEDFKQLYQMRLRKMEGIFTDMAALGQAELDSILKKVQEGMEEEGV